MKAILFTLLILSISNAKVVDEPEKKQTKDTRTEPKELSKEDSEELEMQQEFLKQFQDMYDSQMQNDFAVDNQKKPAMADKELRPDESKREEIVSAEKTSLEQKSLDNVTQAVDSTSAVEAVGDAKASIATDSLKAQTDANLVGSSQQKMTGEVDQNQMETNVPFEPVPSLLQNYTPPVFAKPLAKSFEAARKLEDDDKMEDIEKRLFSIEDKIDHLLMHAGHEITPHKVIWTPWGMHIMPNYNNPDSMHHKLSMVDHLFGHGMEHGMGFGMGHGMGFGMGHYMPPMGFGHMAAMGYGMGGHMMGIGHNNPYGYGLDNVGGGWNHFGVTGLGRRANYTGSSNPYYEGNGSII